MDYITVDWWNRETRGKAMVELIQVNREYKFKGRFSEKEEEDWCR